MEEIYHTSCCRARVERGKHETIDLVNWVDVVYQIDLADLAGLDTLPMLGHGVDITRQPTQFKDTTALSFQTWRLPETESAIK
jgi:hypothetical protein